MKKRTIEDLHDRHYGHKKFANICDELIKRGYEITDIKEYNEQFKFKCNGYEFAFRKEWKSSVKDFVNYFINVFNTQMELIKYMEAHK